MTPFSSLAEDLDHAGIRVRRAFCATEAIIQYLMFHPQIVIANVDLPDQSGWLLTAKLTLTKPKPHVWLYKSVVCGIDAARARFLGVEELLAYRNLQELSDGVFASLAGDTSAISAVFERDRLSLDRAVGLQQLEGTQCNGGKR